MNHSPASAWSADEDGRILYLSPTYFSMFQFTQQDAVGKTIPDNYPAEFAQQFLENNKLVFETQQVVETIETAPRPDGSVGEFLVYKFPITGAEESLLGRVAVDITERKRAEEALLRSQQELTDFVENATVGLHWVGADGTILWANQCELDLLGYSREEYIGHHIAEFHADQEVIDDIFQRLSRNETLCGYEARLRHKDGSIRYVSINSNVFWKDGKFIHTRCFSQDITDRKRAEEALREKQERLSIAQQAGRLGVFDLNLQTDENVWSPEIEGLYGLKPGEFEGNYQGWIARLHPDDREKALREMNRAYQTGEYSEDFRVIWPDGSIHLLYARAKVFFDAAGNPLRMLGVNVDISDRKQAEEALRASAERLGLALATAKMGDWSWDATTDIVTFSEQAAEIFGIPSGPYMTWAKMRDLLLHEEDRERVRLAVEQAIREHKDYDIEYRVIHPDGTEQWVAAKGRAQYDASGHVLGMLGVVQDISDHKRTEKALRESENRLRAIFDTEPECVKLVAPDGTLLDMNAAGLEMIEVTSADAAIGQSVYSLIAPEYQEAFKAFNERVCQGEKGTLEFEIVGCQGTRRWMETHAVPLPQASDGTFVQLAITRDITRRKRAEAEREQLLTREQAARAEAEAANRIKDEFLAVLSHELRSPLNPILGWTRLLRTRKFDEQATDRALETIERNAKLQTQLIEDLLDVSRILQGKMALNVCPVNLVNTIEAASETVRLAAEAKGIKIQTQLNSNLELISGDPARLQQIVWNLLSNAVKFTPAGGRLEVRLEQVDSYAQIQVIDTGKGISPEFLPHVFDYFRQADSTITRKFGGLGLGLAIVRHLVELHGGTVQAESLGEGQGATFRVRLPQMLKVSEIFSSNPPSTTTVDLSSLRILVVDDEADMRDLVVVILKEYGANVKVAASAAEALLVLDQFKTDLLISDIGMPEMDGYTLMRQVRAQPPQQSGQIPAIALTAYAGELNHQQALAAGFQMHVSKPVEPEDLVKAIAKLVMSDNLT